jgi:hypothetical protein
MLGAEIFPGKQVLPTVPDFDFPGVRLGPQPAWGGIIAFGTFLGLFAAGVTVAILARQRPR